MHRFEVLGQMTGRRRLWSVDQKLAILAEADHSDNIGAGAAVRYPDLADLHLATRAALHPPGRGAASVVRCRAGAGARNGGQLCGGN
jgi:hypothetical protein